MANLNVESLQENRPEFFLDCELIKDVHKGVL
jgi:hypothetical protein